MDTRPAEGCPHCGRGTDENPHEPGLVAQFWHDVRCWSLMTALFNLAWVWTHPGYLDGIDED